jgi:hypothetical protein
LLFSFGILYSFLALNFPFIVFLTKPISGTNITLSIKNCY